MKILIVGNNSGIAIETLYLQYLQDLGNDVELFPITNLVDKRRNRSLFDKILMRLGLHPYTKKVNRLLVETVNKTSPDITWVFKGLNVMPEALKKLKGNTILVNYNPDHPYIIAGRGSGNKWVTDSVGLYDLHLCYHSGLQKEIEKRFNIPCESLPFGYQLTDEDFEKVRDTSEVLKLCFIGNPDDIRVNLLLRLASKGFEIDVYGHDWDKTELAQYIDKGISVNPPKYGLELWETLRKYRVQLNIFRKHNIGSHNMRSFEIPGVGGIQLSPYSDELKNFFLEEEEIFLYRDEEELAEKANRLLSLPESEALTLRENARNRSIQSNYSYTSRASLVHDIFKRLIT